MGFVKTGSVPSIAAGLTVGLLCKSTTAFVLTKVLEYLGKVGGMISSRLTQYYHKTALEDIVYSLTNLMDSNSLSLPPSCLAAPPSLGLCGVESRFRLC
ncbi:uncharacterized protein GGS25DRAFT_61907 [Hypoxylon fragiforme]|uniref:uncharacterized protein n=1 Tax=Hypoxylon fragiforme TaxID=63214 RepID=UPI0020C634C8|nr:uncharacterized protein GGS25DRAFT_61907 [Hypoxylon fragiforme]KAI2614691.1 hypothetical protein GGS25DRAFT_61907 [Hypoxylon fragiforme]